MDVSLRPYWRGRVHAWAFVAAVPCGVLLVLSAHSASARVAAVIFAVGVLLVYGTSAAYHTMAQTDRARRVMRRLDHSMIFVLIAATLTPVCILALPQSWGVSVLVVAWSGAAAGIVLKLTAFGKYHWFGYALYPILGAPFAVIFPLLVHRLTGAQMALLIGGVVAYSVGGLLFIAKRPNPWPNAFGYHEMWHVWTVMAGACHFAAVALLVR